jgi:hypothetical protein
MHQLKNLILPLVWVLVLIPNSYAFCGDLDSIDLKWLKNGYAGSLRAERARVFATLACWSYESKQYIQQKMKKTGLQSDYRVFEVDQGNTKVITLHIGQTTTIVIRGTQIKSLDSMLTNLAMKASVPSLHLSPLELQNHCLKTNKHFFQCLKEAVFDHLQDQDKWVVNGNLEPVIHLGYKAVALQIMGLLDFFSLRENIFITGHSQGGAVAEILSYYLVAYRLTPYFRHPPLYVNTFGSPSSGNKVWHDILNGLRIKSMHWVNDKDPVPNHFHTRFIHNLQRRVISCKDGQVCTNTLSTVRTVDKSWLDDFTHHRIETYIKHLRKLK